MDIEDTYGIPTPEILVLYLSSLGNLIEIFKKENKKGFVLEVIDNMRKLLIKKQNFKEDIFDQIEDNLKKQR